MGKIRALLFDLDGVLADLCALHRECFLDAFNELADDSFPRLTAETHEPLEALSTRAKLARYPGVDAEAVFALKQRLTAERLAGVDLGGAAGARVRDALGWARDQGLALGCVTNSVRATLDIVLAKLGVTALIAVTVSNEDVRTPKPDPAGYAAAMAALGVSPQETVIFEDSPAGLAAARASGAHVVRVLDSLDVTSALLAAVVAGGGVQPPPATRLRVVIPMAGLGSRFATDGFVVQKPFLPMPASGDDAAAAAAGLQRGGGGGGGGGQRRMQMWEAVVDNMLPTHAGLRAATEVHIIVRAEQHALFRPTPNVHVHVVPGLTEGPACTVLTLRDIINDDVPLVTANSDQLLDWDVDAFYAAAFHPSYDGAVSCFYHPCPDDLKWSYASQAPDGTVAACAEKRYIGPHATTGVYAWKRGSDFVAFAEAMIAAGERVNNEFYCAPVYNYAIAAGRRFRVHSKARFWGLGVPADYASFMDRPAPAGSAWEAALARKYEGVRCKWGARVPVPQPDAGSDPSLCIALWCTGAFALAPGVAQLRAALEPWAHKFMWYEQGEQQQQQQQQQGGDGGNDAAMPAQLHHTFFQFRTFGGGAEGVPAEQLASWAKAAQAVLADRPPYYLRFVGVSLTRSGLVLCGYPPADYAGVRDALRAAAAPCAEPHAQDIYHVTLLRWTAPLDADEMLQVHAVVGAFDAAPLGYLHPAEWRLGHATWSMRPETLRVAAAWPAPPAPCILHRGNTAGPHSATGGENEPRHLLALLAAGWDVEVDVWGLPGGRVALGHDAPEHALDDPALRAALLRHPRAWLHCKNATALAMLRRDAPRGVQFFSHDADPVAVTSQGTLWVHPDNAAEYAAGVPGCVVVATRPGVVAASGQGVCTDDAPILVKL